MSVFIVEYLIFSIVHILEQAALRWSISTVNGKILIRRQQEQLDRQLNYVERFCFLQHLNLETNSTATIN